MIPVSNAGLDWVARPGTLRPVHRFAASWALVLCMAPAAAVAGEYVGAAACGVCHEAQYKQWRSSGHAVALARLSKVQQRDAGCRSCHTMDPRDPDPELTGVQCESCHGAGRFYAPRHVMKDAELAQLLGLEAVSDRTCEACHTADGPGVRPFDYAEKLALIAHSPKPPPAAEPDAKAPTTTRGGQPARAP